MFPYGLALASFIACLALLAGVALLARRIHLPIVATAVGVGAVFGVAWQWFWGVPYGDAEAYYNFVPALVGDQLTVAASTWFLHPALTPAEMGHIPWPLEQPQASIIVSGLFWALVGLVVGLLVRHHARRA